jgi:hypothetical protein
MSTNRAVIAAIYGKTLHHSGATYSTLPFRHVYKASPLAQGLGQNWSTILPTSGADTIYYVVFLAAAFKVRSEDMLISHA